MKLQALFERKLSKFNLADAVIEAVEVLSHDQFEAFSRQILKDADFIAAHKSSMYSDENGARHCLLVLDEASDNGILVDSQGYDYARYAAWMPGIKPYFDAQIAQLAAELIREGTEQTESGSWMVRFDEIKTGHGITVNPDNGIGEQLLTVLSEAVEMADVKMTADGIDMDFHLHFCHNFTQENQQTM